VNPLFTCFGSANEGLPLNPGMRLLSDHAGLFGFTPNPLGFGYRDLGLGTFLRSGFGSAPNPDSRLIRSPECRRHIPGLDGAQCAMAPTQCPTTEAPGGKRVLPEGVLPHGYIKSLKQLVHFYNTRDVFAFRYVRHCRQAQSKK